MTDELMTEAEIHDFGIEIVTNHIPKDGFVIEGVNTELGSNPQILARKDGRLAIICVRTACFPGHGVLSEEDAAAAMATARAQSGTAYFASVGIANATEGTEGPPDVMSRPVRGAPFYASFAGLQVIAPSNRVTLWRGESSDAAFEAQAVRALAVMWNTLDASVISPLLAEDVVYESQNVLTPLTGRADLLNYLEGKFKTISKTLPSSKVFAELGEFQGRPALVLAQGARENREGAVLVEVGDGKIRRIDLCSVVPHPSEVTGTGEYPMAM